MSGENSDIWSDIGEAIEARGQGDIQVHQIESHLSAEEAERRGYPRHAWAGNKLADELADKAAEEHAIPEGQLGCYEWVRATAVIIRDRICQATRDAFEERPSELASAKQQRADEAREAAKTQVDIGKLVKTTRHCLADSHSQARYDSRSCLQSINKKGPKFMVKSEYA